MESRTEIIQCERLSYFLKIVLRLLTEGHTQRGVWGFKPTHPPLDKSKNCGPIIFVA